jgi:hypothetical protein
VEEQQGFVLHLWWEGSHLEKTHADTRGSFGDEAELLSQHKAGKQEEEMSARARSNSTQLFLWNSDCYTSQHNAHLSESGSMIGYNVVLSYLNMLANQELQLRRVATQLLPTLPQGARMAICFLLDARHRNDWQWLGISTPHFYSRLSWSNNSRPLVAKNN